MEKPDAPPGATSDNPRVDATMKIDAKKKTVSDVAVTTTFRLFSHGMDPAITNALRVHLNISNLDEARPRVDFEIGLSALLNS